jgi:hypothetical protein
VTARFALSVVYAVLAVVAFFSGLMWGYIIWGGC